MWDLGGGRNSTHHITHPFSSVFFVLFGATFIIFKDRIEISHRLYITRYNVSNLIRGCGDLVTCLRVATPLVSLMENMMEEVNLKALKTR